MERQRIWWVVSRDSESVECSAWNVFSLSCCSHIKYFDVSESITTFRNVYVRQRCAQRISRSSCCVRARVTKDLDSQCVVDVVRLQFKSRRDSEVGHVRWELSRTEWWGYHFVWLSISESRTSNILIVWTAIQNRLTFVGSLSLWDCVRCAARCFR